MSSPRYIVKPSEAEGFIKAVAKVTKAVSKEEEGSDVYGLSKVCRSSPSPKT